MGERWCGRCRVWRPIEWREDFSFGPRAESARCPVCGTVWGVRDRRKVPAEALLPAERGGLLVRWAVPQDVS
ncbi:MAG: hypothetical protein C4290_02495 [Chloroflexota bacterium]